MYEDEKEDTKPYDNVSKTWFIIGVEDYDARTNRVYDENVDTPLSGSKVSHSFSVQRIRNYIPEELVLVDGSDTSSSRTLEKGDILKGDVQRKGGKTVERYEFTNVHLKDDPHQKPSVRTWLLHDPSLTERRNDALEKIKHVEYVSGSVENDLQTNRY